MSAARVVAAVVLVAFTAFTLWVTEAYGLGGFFGWVFHNAATTQVFVDLSISLTLAMLAITADARARGKPSWPYWVLALLTGSIGPLVYWVIHGGARGSGLGSRAGETTLPPSFIQPTA
jgi:hypothetical protein